MDQRHITCWEVCGLWAPEQIPFLCLPFTCRWKYIKAICVYERLKSMDVSSGLRRYWDVTKHFSKTIFYQRYVYLIYINLSYEHTNLKPKLGDIWSWWCLVEGRGMISMFFTSRYYFLLRTLRDLTCAYMNSGQQKIQHESGIASLTSVMSTKRKFLNVYI